jgi:acetolactate synthase-1/2/3 large subunit
MRHDYANFGFTAADVIVVVGYELQEFDPSRSIPNGTRRSSTCTGPRPRSTSTTP